MQAIPTDTIDMLEQTFTAITALGSGLTELQWKTESDLPGWTVQDNLSHLIGTERMMQGLPPTDQAAVDRPYLKNPIGEFNEREVEARRTLTGEEVLSEWNELVALRLSTLRTADEAAFEAPMKTPTGPGTMADFLALRVLDCWSHEQDMRRALGMPGDFGTASAEHTIDRLTTGLPMVIGKRVGVSEGDAVTVHITGPVERTLTYEVTGGRAAQVDLPSKPAVATVRLDCETFVTLALGRRPASAFAGKIALEGDIALATAVIERLTMMI